MRRIVTGERDRAPSLRRWRPRPPQGPATPRRHTATTALLRPTPRATGGSPRPRSAAQLVAAKPEVLKAGKHESFKAGKVLSSMGLNYVPYERTYRGLPVVGGDFVVSTDDHGRILATSVAQTRKVKLALDQGHGLQGDGPRHERAPAAARDARQEPPRRPAAQALPAGLGDLGDRSQAR